MSLSQHVTPNRKETAAISHLTSFVLINQSGITYLCVHDDVSKDVLTQKRKLSIVYIKLFGTSNILINLGSVLLNAVFFDPFSVH